MEPGLVVAHIVMLLMAALLAAFVGYESDGREEPVTELIPAMLSSVLDSDRIFARA